MRLSNAATAVCGRIKTTVASKEKFLFLILFFFWFDSFFFILFLLHSLPIMDNQDQGILPIQVDSFQKNYYMISRLGYGSFGYALLAKYKKNINNFLDQGKFSVGTMMEPIRNGNLTNVRSTGLVAVKVMKTQLKNPSDYLRVNEVKFILSIPSHPNLLQIYNLFIDETSGKLNIVMEPMNQNLYQFIQKHVGRPLSSKIVKGMLYQLLSAIRHIHSHGYFHRDVKPENILVTSTQQYYGAKHDIPREMAKDAFVLKLCDYGLAKSVKNKRVLTPYVSTRWYRAPEILLRHANYSRPIDIWAFASVAVELVNFRPIFCGRNETDQLWQVLKVLGHPGNSHRNDIGGKWLEAIELSQNLGFTMPYAIGNSIHHILPSLYHELAETIKYCFLWDPDSRPTAEELFRSTYFKEYNTLGKEVLNLLPTPVSPTESFGGACEEYDDFASASASRDCSEEPGVSSHHAHVHPRISGLGQEIQLNSSQEVSCDYNMLSKLYFQKYTTIIDSDMDSDRLKSSAVGKENVDAFYDNVDHYDESFANSSFDSHKIAC